MILENVDLSDWKTKKEVIKELSFKGIDVDERKIRLLIEDHNDKFVQHLSDTYIAHSNKGYKKTTDYEEIKSSINDMRKRALDMLCKESKVRKAIGENCNFKLIINEDSFAYVEM